MQLESAKRVRFKINEVSFLSDIHIAKRWTSSGEQPTKIILTKKLNICNRQ